MFSVWLHHFHSGPSSIDLSQHERLPLEKLYYDKPGVISILKTALRNAAVPGHHLAKQTMRFENARSQAQKELQVATPRRDICTEQGTVTIGFTALEDAIQSLSLIYALNESADSLLFQADMFSIVKEPGKFVLIPQMGNLIPLHQYLRKQGRLHYIRVQLILSFTEALAEWVAQGITLMDFRADNPDYRYLYLVRPTDTGPRFVMGDINVFNYSEKLFDGQWIRSSVLAKAIRYLYYGSITNRGIKNTRLYRARWNDNVVNELADWLDYSGFVKVNDFVDMLKDLFKDETSSWPLVFSDVDPQFIRDTMDAGFKSIANVISHASPTHLIEDRGNRKENVIYAFWREAQIGLFSESADTFSLYRYMPYLTRRWSGTRNRDFAMAIPLKTKQYSPIPVLIGLNKQFKISDIVFEIFGLPPD